MESRKIFNKVEAAVLVALVDKKDPTLQAVFDLLLGEGDLADAIDSLKRLTLIRCGKREESRAKSVNSTLSSEALETLELVEALFIDQVICELEQTVLEQLIRRHDDRVLAAHETYTANQDLEDFIDTLQHIALMAAPSEAAVASTNAVSIKSRRLSQELEMEEETALLDAMFRLVENGKLSPDDAAQLAELLIDHDPLIMAIFDVFALDKDEEDFVDSLCRLVIHMNHGVKQANEGGSEATMTDDDFEWVSDEDDDEEEKPLSKQNI